MTAGASDRPEGISGAGHVPVLLSEVLEALGPGAGETALDCTAGLGGHAAAIAQRIGNSGTLVLCDLDRSNLEAAEARVLTLGAVAPRVIAIHGSFSDLPRRMAQAGLSADVVLADLGFSSNQVQAAERGFSFSRDGPLDMRLDPSAPVTAAELVNTLPERELAEIIRDFGEERWAARIAAKIVQERRSQPIETTARLAAVARLVVGRRSGSSGIDAATRTFQALRIAVNDEIGRLESLLGSIDRGAGQVMAGAPTWLAPGARIGIIAFHSLEDRPVKRAFSAMVEKGRATLVNKKPVQAGDEEVARNPRSRSARFRAVRLGRLSGTPPA